MAKIEITCRLCGNMLSATADAADANLRTAAIRIFEQHSSNHTCPVHAARPNGGGTLPADSLIADWMVSWKQ